MSVRDKFMATQNAKPDLFRDTKPYAGIRPKEQAKGKAGGLLSQAAKVFGFEDPNKPAPTARDKTLAQLAAVRKRREEEDAAWKSRVGAMASRPGVSVSPQYDNPWRHVRR